MRWCDRHASDIARIRSLLSTICYTNLPEQYLTGVMLPHVQRALPDVTQLTCSVHPTHDVTQKPMMVPVPAPAEIYLLKYFNIVTSKHTMTMNKRNPDAPLFIRPKRKHGKQRNGDQRFHDPGYFVLYDEDTLMESYPVAGTLNLCKLRQIVEKCSKLRFMFVF